MDGNTILLVEGNPEFSIELQKEFEIGGAIVFTANSLESALESVDKFSFDVIVCSYYLPDGLIHHLIDWSKENLDQLPIFLALGSSIPADDELLRRHLISGTFSKKSEPEKIVTAISKLLFDFDKFYQSLLEMIEPKGVQLELVVKDEKYHVGPIEMTDSGIFVAAEKKFEMGTFGLLRISVFEDDYLKHFTLVGSLDGVMNGGQHFKINESYENTWFNLLNLLQEKQMSITRFLAKVADK